MGRGFLLRITMKQRPHLLLRIDLIQHPIHRQFCQGNHLLDGQRHVALRAGEAEGQLAGYYVGGSEGFAAVSQQAFFVDVGGDDED